MENVKLIVRNIIGAPVMTDKGSFSRVTVSTELFRLIANAIPKLAYTTANDNGKKVRVFDVEGVKLYSYFDYQSLKPLFFMDTAQAQAHLVSMETENATSSVSIGLSQFLATAKSV